MASFVSINFWFVCLVLIHLFPFIVSPSCCLSHYPSNQECFNLKHEICPNHKPVVGLIGWLKKTNKENPKLEVCPFCPSSFIPQVDWRISKKKPRCQWRTDREINLLAHRLEKKIVKSTNWTKETRCLWIYVHWCFNFCPTLPCRRSVGFRRAAALCSPPVVSTVRICG